MSKRNDTLILGVVYPGVEPFLKSYFQSLIEQTKSAFDLLILNDGYQGLLPDHNLNLDIMEIQGNKTIAQVRGQGIQYAITNEYEYLIFSDTDDCYSSNYVEILTEGLDKADFVYSKITPVEQNGHNAVSYFSMPQATYNYSSLLDYNYIGLSSSGVKTEKLEKIRVPKDVVAIDWFIYTFLLLSGFSGKYIDNATIFYRQYDDNLVGTKKSLNSDRLEKGIKVKQIHYHYICEYCKNNNLLAARKDYETKKDEIQELQYALAESDFRVRYMDAINANMNKIYRGWWSEILTLNDWEKYAN